MQSTTLAPGTLTGTYPLNGDIERGYELINDRLVEMPPMSNRDMTVADNVLIHLSPFVRKKRLGRVGREWIVRLQPDARRSWRPDAAFVSFERWPIERQVPDIDPWDIVPELVVEVISHTNTADDTMDRLQAYFGAGSKQVWVVYPRHGRVYVYTAETKVQILTPADELDGGDLFPGFRVPVPALFEDVPLAGT
jgi:Uma2 family endonuclease